MAVEEKFQRDIRDFLTRRELLRALAAMSAIALLPTPILALAQYPNPQSYSGLEINTKIVKVNLIDNDLVFIDSMVTIYKDGKEVNNSTVKVFVLRTAPSILIPPSILIINDRNGTVGVAVGYDQYVKVTLPPNTPDYVVVNELIKKALSDGMNDVIRTINIINSKTSITISNDVR